MIILALAVAIIFGVLLSGILIDKGLEGWSQMEAAENEREVQERNMEAWKEYQKQQLEEFRRSRGSEGNAFLPMYFGSGDQSFERQLANDYKTFYNRQAPVDPRTYEAAMQQYMPMVDAARGTLADVYNGNLLQQRMAYLQPVMDARTQAAQGQQAAIQQALMQQRNAIAARNAQRGFMGGGGKFANNQMLGATIGANQAAANNLSQVNLQNAMDRRGVQESTAQQRIGMIGQPFAQAQNQIGFMQMPSRAAANEFQQRLAPLDTFKIGTAMPNLIAPMQEKPIATNTQIWAQTGADMAHNIQQAALAYFSGGASLMQDGGGFK